MTRSIFFVIVLTVFLWPAAPSNAQGTAVPDTVIATAGEGIYALLRRTDRNPSVALPDFIELNRDKLGIDSSLIKGFTYLIPPRAAELAETPEVKEMPYGESHPPEERLYPIFGDKYATLAPRDSKLQGAVYYLVSGHSGPDPGAIGKYGPYTLSEDEYSYDVTLRLARRLMEHGATVYIIVQDKNDGIRDEPILEMDKDEVHYPNDPIPANQVQRLRKRVAVVNKLYMQHKGSVQRMLVLHIDSRSQSENIDVFFYHHANSSSGKHLAASIHETFKKKYQRHQPHRSYSGSIKSRSGLYVIKHSYPPTVFIELGNIQNEKDQRRFVIPDNRQALANWIAEGILHDYSKQ